jgi:hypothetical protein
MGVFVFVISVWMIRGIEKKSGKSFYTVYRENLLNCLYMSTITYAESNTSGVSLVAGE